MNKQLTREMGKYIGSMNWEIFSTLTYHNGCKEHFNRKMMEYYYQKNKNLINRMFFITERNKNYTNVHSHILISTNSVKKLLRRNKPNNKFGYFHNVEIDDDTFVTDEGVLSVGYYVSKFYDREVDWDIFL